VDHDAWFSLSRPQNFELSASRSSSAGLTSSSAAADRQNAAHSDGGDPQAFACNVCRLTLHGPQELTEGQLPTSQHSVDPEDLGEDFDPEYFAESEYGLQH